MDFLCLLSLFFFPLFFFFFLRPLYSHTRRFCVLKAAVAHLTAARKFPALTCYPSILFTIANTGHVCARPPVQLIARFRRGLFAQVCSSNWDRSGSYLQQANNYHITPQRYSSSMLNDPSPVAAKSYSSPARLILCKPFNWILLRREPMSYPCTCSSTRHISHPSVQPRTLGIYRSP